MNKPFDQAIYERWLQRKATAHVRRDRRRGNGTASIAAYKAAIHQAVVDSRGLDAYTGEALDWSLLSKYDNDASRRHKRAYKKGFALLPTVDHVDDGLGPAHFRICAWRTNSCKNDLDHAELVSFCRKILAHADKPF